MVFPGKIIMSLKQNVKIPVKCILMCPISVSCPPFSVNQIGSYEHAL